MPRRNGAVIDIIDLNTEADAGAKIDLRHLVVPLGLINRERFLLLEAIILQSYN